MSGDCIRGSSWQLLFLSVPIPSLLSPLLPSSCFPRAFPASNHWDFITHTQNCCSVHPPPARMSSFAEEERAEHLPWLRMEEESKTDKKKKKETQLLVQTLPRHLGFGNCFNLHLGFPGRRRIFQCLSFLCCWLFPNSLLLAFIHPGWKQLAPGAQNGN